MAPRIQRNRIDSAYTDMMQQASVRSDPRGVVLLHSLPPAKGIPSLSPPGLKLETFLRMAEIPYRTHYSVFKHSSKGKWPWLTHAGKDIADSNFCMEYLTDVFDVHMDDWLSEEQKGICTTLVRTCEEHLYWIGVYSKFYTNGGEYAKRNIKFVNKSLPNTLLFWSVRRNLASQLKAQGLGRHSKDEILSIARRDLHAISNILGTKSFVMGEEPCSTDACVFAITAQLLWMGDEYPIPQMIYQDFPNLLSYRDRMISKYWIDWCTYETDEWQGESFWSELFGS